MDTKNRVTVNFVSTLSDGSFALNLVEQGPWQSSDSQKELRRIQDRLYNCFDALVDGHVFEKYPKSKGKKGIIRLACYDLASEEIDPFLEKFTHFVNSSIEYQRTIERSEFTSSIEFSVTYDKRNKTTEPVGGQNSGGCAPPRDTSAIYKTHKSKTMERAYKISHRIGKLLLIISLILIALLFLGTFVGIQTTTFAGPIAVTLILSLLLLAAPFFLKKILRD